MKNREKKMSIGDVAKTINVTRRMIINYEQRGLITPDEKEGTLGNRYYSMDSITRIRTIRVFQDMGLSLNEIAAYFNDTVELELLINRLETLRDEINLNIEKLRARANPASELKIERVTLPAQCIYRKVHFTETVDEKKEMLRTTLIEAFRLYSSDTSKRMFFTEYCYNAPNEVSYCISIPSGSEGEYVYNLAESQALCVTLHGGYGELPMLHEKMIEYAKKKSIHLTGICRHTYLEGPPQHQDEHKFITQVVMKIGEK